MKVVKIIFQQQLQLTFKKKKINHLKHKDKLRMIFMYE